MTMIPAFVKEKRKRNREDGIKVGINEKKNEEEGRRREAI